MTYRFNSDKTNEYRFQKWDATTTLAIWTPRTGNRFILRNLNVQAWGAAAAAGTFALFLGSTSTNPLKVAEFGLGGSAMIAPIAAGFESTGVNYILYGVPSAGGTSSHFAFAEGFDIE